MENEHVRFTQEGAVSLFVIVLINIGYVPNIFSDMSGFILNVFHANDVA